MVIVGVDAHKKSHTMVAIDEQGRRLGERTVPATTAGHHVAFRWVRKTFEGDVRWAVEDVRALTIGWSVTSSMPDTKSCAFPRT